MCIANEVVGEMTQIEMADLCEYVYVTLPQLSLLSDESSIDLLNKLCYISSIYKFTLQYRYTEQIKELFLHYTEDSFLNHLISFENDLKLKFIQNIYYMSSYYKYESNVLVLIDNLIEKLVDTVSEDKILEEFPGFLNIYKSKKTLSNNKIQQDISQCVDYYKTLCKLSLSYPPIDLAYNEMNPCESIIRLLKLTGFDMDYITAENTVITKIHNFILCELHYKPLYKLLKSILEGRWTICVGVSNSGKSDLLKNLAYGYFSQPQYPYFNSVPLGSHIDSSVLHGMYVCSTKEPGKYLWKPGFIPQSLSLGSWLLMENWEHSNKLIQSYIAPVVNDVMSYVPNVGYIAAYHRRFHLFITKTVQSVTHFTASSIENEETSYDLKHTFPNCEIIHFSSYTTTDVSNIIAQMFPVLQPLIDDLIGVLELSMDSSIRAGNHLPLKELFRLCYCLTTLQNETSNNKIFLIKHNKNIATQIINAELLVKLIIDFLCPTSCASLILLPSTKITNDHSLISFVNEVCARFNVTLESLYSYVMNKLANNYTSDSFFMTKPVKKAIHTIEMCITNNFPVLLVGETGAGKTSIIQQLVSFNNNTTLSLKVVNMGIQSEASDLIGGFKPFPIITQIIDLFNLISDEGIPLPKQYILETKQQLEKLSTLNRNDFHQMKSIICELQKRFKYLSVSADIKNNYKSKTSAIYSLLDKGFGVCFKFSEGVLLDCMRHGHWLLIDEINMAPADTLHVISLVLNGQLSSMLFLVDDNQFSVHPDFRLFGCMNPPTDVNKKSLPPTLQSFFCDIHIEDNVDNEDLTLIINGYLSEFNLLLEIIQKVIEIYSCLSNLSNNTSITHGVRNLCRVLKTARQNYCKNLFRSIYEAFLVVYSNTCSIEHHSQLKKHFLELLLISDKRSKKKDTKCVVYDRPLSCHFDQRESCLQVEGFWLLRGNSKFNSNTQINNYLQTATVKRNLKTICRILSFSQLPILLEGETSVGKTSLITYLSELTHNTCIRINNHDHTDIQDYVGGYTCDNGSFHFQEGPLVNAMRNGHWIILDELNLAPPDVLEMINRVLDDNRELFIPETLETVKAKPTFRLFATQNPMTSGYSGRKPLSKAFRNRFIELTFEELPKLEQIEIIAKVGRVGTQYATLLVEIMMDMRTKRKLSGIFQGKYGFVTLRDLFKIASRFDAINGDITMVKSTNSKRSLKLIEWKLLLSHIALMVLGGKCRDAEDLNTVVECINKWHKNALIENVRDIFSLDYVYCDLIWPSLKEQVCEVIRDNEKFNHLVVNGDFQQTLLLSLTALTNAEPLLLIGPPGTGKTTLCELYAQLTNRRLYTLSCHSGTETADFIGSLYPVRNSHDTCDNQKQLFEWVDGPLIEAMRCGGVFMLDEISLADDAILERLNSLLESNTRSIVVAERGMIVDTHTSKSGNELIAYTVTAHPDFRIVATMNPSGDYGKKELTNALRNRFTEVYCPCYATKESITEVIRMNLVDLNYYPQVENNLSFIELFNDEIKNNNANDFVSHLLNTLDHIATNLLNYSWESFVSIRKVIFMVKFVKRQFEYASLLKEDCICVSDRNERLFDVWWEAICAIFLDKFSALLLSRKDLIKCKNFFMGSNSIEISTKHLTSYINNDGNLCYGVEPYIYEFERDNSENQINGVKNENNFHFESVIESCYKIFRAMRVDQPILLEGPPGSGKTSIVMNLAYKNIARINLSEQTEISDLFGFDMPIFDGESVRFEWKNGPFLEAMQKGYWILLDEINLASQTVLEGLNACFDHRAEIYVNSLGRSFCVDHKNTRIFAAQNPAEFGGGRKQLPASFTDRFIRIYFNPLSESDIFNICSHGYFTNNEDMKKLSFLNEIFCVISHYTDFKNNNSFQSMVYQMRTNFRSISRWCILSQQHSYAQTTILFYNFLMVFVFAIKDSLTRRDLTEFLWKNLCFHSTLTKNLKDYNYDDIMHYFKIELTCDKISFGHFSVERPPAIKNHYIAYVGIERLSRKINPFAPNMSNTKRELTNEVFASICCAVYNNMPLIVNSYCNTNGILQWFEVFKLFAGRNIHIISGNSDMDLQYLLGSYEISSASHLLTELLFVLENSYNKFNELKELKKECVKCGELSFVIYNTINKCYTMNADKNSVGENKYELELKPLKDFLCDFCCEEHSSLFETEFKINEIVQLLEKLINKRDKSDGFRWVNGHLIDSMINGRWCVIDNANLCSLSVLDRLNSLLEPNGSLILDNYDGRRITPHKDFRLFLLCDLSLGGELSDAMRNRCLELYIDTSSLHNINQIQNKKMFGFKTEELSFDLDCVVVKMFMDYCDSLSLFTTESDYLKRSYLYEVVSCFLYNHRQFKLFTSVLFDQTFKQTPDYLDVFVNLECTQQFFNDFCNGIAYNHHLSYLCDSERLDELKKLPPYDMNDLSKFLSLSFHTTMHNITINNKKVDNQINHQTITTYSILNVVKESYVKFYKFLDTLSRRELSPNVDHKKLVLSISMFCVWLSNTMDHVLSNDIPTNLKYQWIWYYMLVDNCAIDSDETLRKLFHVNNSISKILDKELLGCDIVDFVVFLNSYRSNIRCPSFSGKNWKGSKIQIFNYFNTFDKSNDEISECILNVFGTTIDPLNQINHISHSNSLNKLNEFNTTNTFNTPRVFHHLLTLLSNNHDFINTKSISNLFKKTKKVSTLVTSFISIDPQNKVSNYLNNEAISHLLKCDILNGLVNSCCAVDYRLNPRKLELVIPHLYFERKLTKYRHNHIDRDSYEFLLALLQQNNPQLNMSLETYLKSKNNILSYINYVDTNFNFLRDWPIKITNEICELTLDEVSLLDNYTKHLLSRLNLKNLNNLKCENKVYSRIVDLQERFIPNTIVELNSLRLSEKIEYNLKNKKSNSLSASLNELGRRLFRVGCEWCSFLCVSTDVDFVLVDRYVKSKLNDYYEVISKKLELFEQFEKCADSLYSRKNERNIITHYYNLIIQNYKERTLNFDNEIDRDQDDHSTLLYEELHILMKSISAYINEISSNNVITHKQLNEANESLDKFISNLLDKKYYNYLDLTICLASKLLLVRLSIQLMYWSLLFTNEDSYLKKNHLDFKIELIDKRPYEIELFSNTLNRSNMEDKDHYSYTITQLYLSFMNMCHISEICRFNKLHFNEYFNFLLSAVSRLKAEILDKINQDHLSKQSIYKYQSHIYNKEDDEANIERNIRTFFNELNEEFNDFELDDLTFNSSSNKSTNSYSYEDLLKVCQKFISKLTIYLTNNDNTMKKNEKSTANKLLIDYYDFANIYINANQSKHSNIQKSITSSVADIPESEINLSTVRVVFDSILIKDEKTEFIESNDFDIYHKPFPNLVLTSANLIKSITTFATNLLKEYPEHAGLIDIEKACQSYISIGMDSPLITYLNSATKILMTLENWNVISPTHLHFDSLSQLKDLIISWRNMQTKHWIALVDTRKTLTLTNTIHHVSDVVICLDIIKTHSSIGDINCMCDKLEVVVKNFIEKSSMVDFQYRLECLRYFAKQFVVNRNNQFQWKLYWLFENLYYFYSQFIEATQQHFVKSTQAPLDNIKDFVDIAKWKSFNYWSIKESTAKAHRVIYSNIRKLECVYYEPVKSFFVGVSLGDSLKQFKELCETFDNSSICDKFCFDSKSDLTDKYDHYYNAEFALFNSKVERSIKLVNTNLLKKLNVQEKILFTGNLVDDISELLTMEQSATKETKKDVTRCKAALLLRLLNDLKLNFNYSYRRGIALKNSKHHLSDDKFYSMFVSNDDNNYTIDDDFNKVSKICQQLYCSILTSYINYASSGKYSQDVHISLIERMSGYIELLFDSVKCQRLQLFNSYNVIQSLLSVREMWCNLRDMAGNKMIFVINSDILSSVIDVMDKVSVTVEHYRILLPAFINNYPNIKATLDELMSLVNNICGCVERNDLICLNKIVDPEEGLNKILKNIDDINIIINREVSLLPLCLKRTLEQHLNKLMNDINFKIPANKKILNKNESDVLVRNIINKFIILHQNTMKISGERKDCIGYLNGRLNLSGENEDSLLNRLSHLYEDVVKEKMELSSRDFNCIIFCVETTLKLSHTLFIQLLKSHQSHLVFCNVLFAWFGDVFTNGYAPTIPDDQEEQITDGDPNVGGFNICENPSNACQDVSNQIENQDQVEENQQNDNNNEDSQTPENLNNDEKNEGIEMGEDFNDFQDELFGDGLIDEESVDDEVNGDVDQSQIMDEFDEKLWQDQLTNSDNDDIDDQNKNNQQQHIEDTETVANEDNAELSDTNLDTEKIDLLNDQSLGEDMDVSDEDLFDNLEMNSSISNEEVCDEDNNNTLELGGEMSEEENNANNTTMPTGFSSYDQQIEQASEMDNKLFQSLLNNINNENQQHIDNGDSGCGTFNREQPPPSNNMDDPSRNTSFESQKRSRTVADLDNKQLADSQDESVPTKKSNIVDSIENDTNDLPTNSVTHTDQNQKYDSLAVDVAKVSTKDEEQTQNIPDDSTLPTAFDEMNSEIDPSNDVKNDELTMKQGDAIIRPWDTYPNIQNEQEVSKIEEEIVDKFDNVDSWCKFDATNITSTHSTYPETFERVETNNQINSYDSRIFMNRWLEYLKAVEKHSHELCEQLRTIIEPTQAKKLGGSYRTGKKLNMRKVITYLASQFTKDRIWMRRIKPTQRTYQIMLAIDDSTSMQDNQSKDMAFESLAMLTKAFNLLDIGQVGLCCYGESTKQLIDFNHQKYSPNSPFYATVMSQLTFSQNKTNVANLLRHCINQFSNQQKNNSTNHSESVSTQLLIVLSDGRGIFSEGTKVVHDSINHMKSLGIFVLYVILDNPHSNKEPIDKINVPIFEGGKLLHIKSYMEMFPFAHYIVLRKITALPQVLAQAVRQWVEVVTLNSG